MHIPWYRDSLHRLNVSDIDIKKKKKWMKKNSRISMSVQKITQKPAVAEQMHTIHILCNTGRIKSQYWNLKTHNLTPPMKNNIVM